MSKRIIVLGGGYAGVLTAKKLAKRLRKADVEISLIDRNSFHTMLTELHEVAAWRVDEDSIRIDLKRVFAGRKVNVVLDTITEVDYEGKRLVGEQGTYDYDYLVLATGSKPTFFGNEGARENSYTLWSYDDAVKLRERIMQVFREAVSEPDEAKKRHLLSFFIVGAGFTGVEMAGELAELVPILCRRFDIDRSFVSIYEGDMLERAVPTLPEKLSAKVQRRLEKMGVTLMLGRGITDVQPEWVEYKAAGSEQVERLEVHTVIWTAGIEGSEIASAATGLELKGRGRVQTDEYLRALGREEVFVGGDNLFYIVEGEAAPVPQMVENAEHSAETIAKNITAAVTGSGHMESYKPKFHGMMVCIGGRYGVAHVGMPGKFFALPSFLAMFSKHFINVVYFIQVLGWNKVMSYLRHEFFTIRDKRSFVGGHFSNRTPSFLLAPMRVYLGAMWLYEGMVKISEGWLRSPKLTGFFAGANTFYDGLRKSYYAFNVATSPIITDATVYVDTVTSASTAWTGGGLEGGHIISTLAEPILLDVKFLGFLRMTVVKAGEAAIKFQMGIVDWLINSVVLPKDSVQMVFQGVIVVLEILIGLALMGGLLTTMAAFGSLALLAMFLCSTGLYSHSWWMVFAAVAVLIGGGSTFGLDYWVMPKLKEGWKKLGFVKKWYLYHD